MITGDRVAFAALERQETVTVRIANRLTGLFTDWYDSRTNSQWELPL
jgi:hypothetical protein